MARNFLSLEELSRAQIESLLAQAAELKALGRTSEGARKVEGVVVNLFFEPSTRTRVSFEIAAHRLGLDVVNWTHQGSSQEKGESLLDTALNVAAMGPNAIVVRHSAAGSAAFLAAHLPCAVINAGDGAHSHPTQALLDALTLRERLGSIAGKVIAIVGDIAHSRVARSNLHCLTTLGARVRLCGPRRWMPREIESLAPGAISVHRHLEEALREVDAVMALRIQRERLDGSGLVDPRQYRERYQITRERLEAWAPHAVVLHPGPINRGLELAGEVADGPSSAVLAQVENGVAVRMAVLTRALGAGFLIPPGVA